MRRFYFFCGFVLSLALTGCVHYRSIPQRNVTFLLYDAGETKALAPVFDYLDSRKVPQQIIAIGTARELMKEHRHFVDIQKSCDVSSKINSKWPRELPLPQSELQKIQSCIDPTLVVTGMVSVFQEQLTAATKTKNKTVWGYYDSFSEEGIREVSSQFTSNLHKILVPSLSLKKAFQKRVPSKSIEVVGQPTLEEWRREATQLDARKILDKLELTKAFPIIVYAGGYGKDYETAFKTFVRESAHLDDCVVLISLHPKSDGSLEEKIIRDKGANHIRIIPKSIPTKEAAMISDLVVTHRSSVGVQAVFLGKPVIYLDTHSGAYSDLALEHHWATQITNANEFVPTVRARLKEKIYNLDKDVFVAFGIPKDSAAVIGRLIENRVVE